MCNIDTIWIQLLNISSFMIKQVICFEAETSFVRRLQGPFQQTCEVPGIEQL